MYILTMNFTVQEYARNTYRNMNNGSEALP